jgi:hypothetical protein
VSGLKRLVVLRVITKRTYAPAVTSKRTSFGVGKIPGCCPNDSTDSGWRLEQVLMTRDTARFAFTSCSAAGPWPRGHRKALACSAKWT